MLTSKQRAILRGKANTMDTVFIVGKGEIDETMIQGVKDCLDARELDVYKRQPEESRPRDKRLRYMAQAQRAVASFQHWLDETSL